MRFNFLKTTEAVQKPMLIRTTERSGYSHYLIDSVIYIKKGTHGFCAWIKIKKVILPTL